MQVAKAEPLKLKCTTNKKKSILRGLHQNCSSWIKMSEIMLKNLVMFALKWILQTIEGLVDEDISFNTFKSP